MFKNFLTYSFALRFQRSCQLLKIPRSLHERLMQSGSTLTQQFHLSTRAPDPKDELKHLCVALMALRDCRETLEQTGALSGDLKVEFTILHARIEQLCLKASEADHGQLRMLG